MLSLYSVSISFDNLQIIKNITFDISEGEVVSIVGESGVGKTTLLKAIAGLIDVKGKIIFDGVTVIGPNERLMPGVEGVATVFQDYQLMHNRTVYENIAYPLRSYNEEDQRTHTDELLKVLMLDSHRNHYPKELSGGQKQRAAIARALADEPTLLLMDEPFSNMDVALKEVVKSSVFAYLKQENITAILVTHDPKDALAISDQIAVLKSGNIAQLTTPETMYEQPKDQYIMSCFGHCNYWTKEAFELDFGEILEGETNEVGVRVSDMSIQEVHELTVDVVVLTNVYQGENYLIKGECNSGTEIYFFSFHQIPCGDRIVLSIDNSKIVYFE